MKLNIKNGYQKKGSGLNLFDVIILYSWPKSGSNGGGTKTHPVETILEARELMDGVIKCREQRKY